MINRAFLILLLTIPSTSLRAEDAESIREVCRRHIAGAFLTTYNQWARNKDYFQLLSTQMKNLAKAEKTAHTDYKQKQAQMDESEYDVEVLRAYTASKDRWENIKTQISENTKLLEKSEIEMTMAKKEVDKLRKAMDPVFDFKIPKNRANQFPHEITFKNPCPKFRYTCPLPNKVAYDLRDIPLAGEQCKKYVTYSIGMNRK